MKVIILITTNLPFSAIVIFRYYVSRLMASIMYEMKTNRQIWRMKISNWWTTGTRQIHRKIDI